MWPFSRRAAPSRFVPAPPYFGGGPAGGDAFWSWGSLGGGSISPDAAETLAEVPGHPLQRLIDEGVSSSETWSDLIEGLLDPSFRERDGGNLSGPSRLPV